MTRQRYATGNLPVVLMLAAALLACATPVPPTPPAPRAGTEVAVSMGKVWDATIDLFGDSTLAIANIERASGFISAVPVKVGSTREQWATTGHPWADCGKNAASRFDVPTDATYSVVIRGDSVRTIVKASARFVHDYRSAGMAPIECASKGQWESAFESLIVERALKKKAP